jgi:hypothetical protein
MREEKMECVKCRSSLVRAVLRMGSVPNLFSVDWKCADCGKLHDVPPEKPLDQLKTLERLRSRVPEKLHKFLRLDDAVADATKRLSEWQSRELARITGKSHGEF